MPNSITISGFTEFADKAKTLATQFPKELDQAAKFAAQSWQQRAARSAPVDQGRLGQRISSQQIKEGVWEVDSPSNYSAVMEWGTKSLISIPPELQSYAAGFRGLPQGKGAWQAIKAWAGRVGIKNAFPVFLKIMRVGVRPHPFFFVHKPQIEQQMIRDIKQLIKPR